MVKCFATLKCGFEYKCGHAQLVESSTKEENVSRLNEWMNGDRMGRNEREEQELRQC